MQKEFDVNMIIDTKLDNYDVEFHNVESEPFRIYGIWREGDKFFRIPDAVAQTVSEGVANKASTTAGGRIRFITNSSFIAVKAEYAGTNRIDVTPITATLGFDVYAGGKYAATYRVPQDTETELVGVREIGSADCDRLITVNLPTHSSLKSLYVGIEKGASLKRAPDYKYEKPVVFYGSSITHGSCASRPGMIYENQISRMLGTNFHNLGFGGVAKGEPEMAEYIAGLDMSVFVLDYDHNSTVEQLAERHEPFFKVIREKNPNLPIIMISRPGGSRSADTAKRFEIIKRTYENAIKAGDKNVYLINGLEFFGELADECMVDGVHPTDFGFHLMAKRIAEVLAPLL